MAKSSYQNRIELVQGTLDMLILKTLMWGEQHGYGISQTIRASSEDVLQVETGSLYPALHRLERAKWVSAEWREEQVQPNGEILPDYNIGKEAEADCRLHDRWQRWSQPLRESCAPMGARHEHLCNLCERCCGVTAN